MEGIVDIFVSKQRCFEGLCEDCESSSKLKVADLCLEPPDADRTMFKKLLVLQKEFWFDYKRRTAIFF